MLSSSPLSCSVNSVNSVISVLKARPAGYSAGELANASVVRGVALA